MRRSHLLAAACSAALLTSAAGAAVAQESGALDFSPEEVWLDDALSGVADELAGLDDLEAVREAPEMVAVVAMVDAAEVDTVADLLDIDDENLFLLELGQEAGYDVSGAVAEALGQMDDVTLQAAVDGNRSVDPGPWLDAMVTLIQSFPEFQNSDIERDELALRMTQLGFGPTTATQTPANGDGDADGLDGDEPGGADLIGGDLGGERPPAEDAGATSPTPQWALPAGAGAVAVALIGLTVVLRRRRQGESAGSTPAMGAVLDASRRMTSALDADQVHRIALRSAVDLSGADGGAWLLSAGGGHWGPSTDGLDLLAPGVDEGPVARAVATGQAVTGPVADEPWIDGRSGTVMAVPVLVDGRVVGAMALVRDRGSFPKNAARDVGMLSPVTGSALAAATTHRGALDASFGDALTALPNRRRLDVDLAGIGGGARFALAMVDVDHFKNFNDTHGHAAGDLALQMVARALESAVRAEDTVYRYGGEEFCILLPRATEDEARRIVERVRGRIGATEVPGGETQPNGRVTASLGVAVRWGTESPTALLERADNALYRAKQQGRDRVVVGT